MRTAHGTASLCTVCAVLYGVAHRLSFLLCAFPPLPPPHLPRPNPLRLDLTQLGTGECLSAVLGVFRIRCLSGVLADAPCWVTPVYNVEASPQPFSLASELGKGQIGKGSVRVEKQWRKLTYELWHVKSRCSGRVWAEMTEGILT